jgi:hypothetical protein
MEDNLDYMNVKTEDKQVLSNLSKMGEHLKQLQLNMLEAETKFEQAKKEFEHYANVILPQEMFSVGIESLTLANGGTIKVQHKYYCQPNKNDADKKIMANWLREHNGEDLIKESATVSTADIDKLKDSNIPFIGKSEINTNALKAFLVKGLGVNSGVQQFSVEDIPACMHFQQVTFAEVEA